MVKYISYILLIVTIVSCNKKVEIIELPLLNYKSSNVKDGKLFYYSGQYFLIKNAPNDKEILNEILLLEKKNSLDKKKKQNNENRVGYIFYKYTPITKTFLEEKYYIPFFSRTEESLINQEDAYLGSIYYYRCKNDTTKWESKINIKYEKSDVDIKDNKHPYYYREEVLESCY